MRLRVFIILDAVANNIAAGARVYAVFPIIDIKLPPTLTGSTFGSSESGVGGVASWRVPGDDIDATLNSSDSGSSGSSGSGYEFILDGDNAVGDSFASYVIVLSPILTFPAIVPAFSITDWSFSGSSC